MNLRRGLVRLWLIASAVWVAFWLWRADIPWMLGNTSAGERPWCTDPLQYSGIVLADDLLLVIGACADRIAWACRSMDQTRVPCWPFKIERDSHLRFGEMG